MDYDAVVEALYERHRSVRDAGFSGTAYKPGLESMLSYAAFLGHPEREFRSIHVAGTNGKGSVCSMLAAAFAARGLRVGLYTSPHLVDFRERIKIIEAPGGHCSPSPSPLGVQGDSCSDAVDYKPRPLSEDNKAGGFGGSAPRPLGVQGDSCSDAVDYKPRPLSEDNKAGGFGGSAPRPLGVQGDSCYKPIPKEAVCAFLERFDREGLTFFEVTTGMAFRWFADEGVDIAVIETGLGGRLDSTNIITPELSVITSIGLDHCDMLGSTRAEIAAEKAGIFKPGVPALAWGRDPETSPVFERIAGEVFAPLFYAEDFAVPPAAENLQMDLSGPCAEINLRTVIAALQLLGVPAGQKADRLLPAIAYAAALTGFRGRWETLLTDPLTICDIGHNPAALEANFRKLAAVRGERAPEMGIRLRPSSLVPQQAAGCGRVTPDPMHCRPLSENNKVGDGSPDAVDYKSRLLSEDNKAGGFGGSAPRPLGVQGDGSSDAVDYKPLLVVYGVMADKAIDDIKHFLPTDAEYFLVQPQTPRALPLDELALKLKNLHVVASGSVAQGVEAALQRARELPGAVVYIGGSTFVVSEAITYIESP